MSVTKADPAPPEKTKIPLGDDRSAPLLKRMWAAFIRPYAGWLFVASIAMAFVAGTTALTAWLMDPVVNEVFVDRNEGLLWLIGAAVLATFVIKSVAAYFQNALLAFVGQRIVADIQSRLFGHLLDWTALFHSGRPEP